MRLSSYLRALAVALSVLGVPCSFAQGKAYTVQAPDGVSLAVQEAGNPEGPPVVFVHGLLGSHLNWAEQLNSPALQRYRLITFDLRGHGLSGKPTAAEAYTEGRRWADDLASVLDAAHAEHPVLVGWSLGAAVITEYLAAYGGRPIAGAVYVDGVIELKPEQITPHPKVYQDMIAQDLQTHLDGERAFLALCFATLPPQPVFERLLANAALASWDMQRAVLRMDIPAAAGLGNLRAPLLLLYGAKDALIDPAPAMARAKQLQPGARSLLYPNAGHAPFLEEPARFNDDLAQFIDTLPAR